MLLYLDACTYISIYKSETVIPHNYAKTLFEAAMANRIKIVASRLVLDEVYQLSSGSDIDGLIKYLENNKNINYINNNNEIAKGARELQDKAEYFWQSGDSTKLKWADAIHLYTAIVTNSDEFHTNDKKILRLNSKIFDGSNLAITPPHESSFYNSFLI